MQLAYEMTGDGPLTVVLTHGLAASQATWAAQVAALAPRHRVLTWDLRGHGASGPNEAPCTLGDLGRHETIAMAQALLDADLEPDTADELVRLTGCNPLFIATLARTMAETGTSSQLSSITSSPKLVDFVAGRLSWLDPAGRDSLAAWFMSSTFTSTRFLV